VLDNQLLRDQAVQHHVGDPIELEPSYAQQRLWFLTRLAGVSEAYHMPFAVALDGPLDLPALRRAWSAVVDRQQALRTRFVEVAGVARCLIDPPGERFALQLTDLSGMPEPAKQAAELRAAEAAAPFDLAAGPLVRARLVRLAPDRHELLITVHHLVSDGWSVGVLARELAALYTAFRAGQADPLPPLPMQYADYAAWQRQWLSGDPGDPQADGADRAGGALAEQAEYWRRTLTGAPALLALPTDRPRPAEQDFTGGQVPLVLDPELTAGLQRLSRDQGSTVFMTVLAGWALVLSRLSGQSEVVIGTPTANRRRAELEGLVGFFVNTLALRMDLSGSPSGAEVLERVRDSTLAALEHQDVPFEQVVELVNPARSLSYSPLFQTMVTWQNGEEAELGLPDVRVTSLGSAYTPAKFDLNLWLAEQDGRIVGGLDYAGALFDRATAERYAGYLRRVLVQLVADPDRPAAALALVDEAERRQLLDRAAEAAGYPITDTLHARVAAQAAATPDAVAVTCEDRSISYRELDEQANRLAHRLREYGVGADRLVAVCLDRSLDLIVGLLAVLKAGGGYLPLDPGNPPERLAYLVDDSKPVLLLAHAATWPAVQAMLAVQPADGAELPVLDLDAAGLAGLPADQPPDADGSPSQLAYVIYTSGSTGRPKGVLVEHANVLRLFAATEREFWFSPADVWTLFHSVAFDFSVWEIWGPLCSGGRLVVVPQLTSRSPADFYRLLCEQGVTVLNQTPSAFRGLIDAQAATDAGHRLRTVVFGGEALDPAMLRPWFDDPRNAGAELVNMYGITETTVHVTYRPVTRADVGGSSPIGRPLSDLRIYLLDVWGEPVPAGVVGELYVGGAGVARGYLNRPELTAERFLDSPFVPGDRLYRTGDLARYRPDGELEYLGRNDFQVKIRGFRIELGEIEARLRGCAGVRDAVVLARQDAAGESRLVGYYIAARGADPAPEQLRGALAAVLPEHMVPAGYVRVRSWPLTRNGKLDRDALPAPDDTALGTGRYVPPEGPVEQALAAIWAEVLGVDRVGRHDHFFALGGHSLLALRVLDRMRRQGLHADIRALFGTPTLAALAAAVTVEAAPAEVPANPIPDGCHRIIPELLPLVELEQPEIDAVVAGVPGGAPNVQDIYPLAPVQEGILFHHLMTPGDDPYLVISALRFDDAARLADYRRALEAVIARHDVLRTSVVWQGVRQPVQVVWRQALLPVTEVELDPAGDPIDQLRAAFAERYGRIPLDRAPLLRLLVGRSPADGRWYALELIHHIIDDNTSLKQLGAEVRAYLAGRADELPAPLPFRDFVARATRGPDRVEHEAFFAELLGDVDSPTAPFGLLDVFGDGRATRQADGPVDPALARRLRASAQRLGVSVASLFHVAWGQLLARACGRPDVVFGTVLFGRMQGGTGTDRVLGPFINTLPVRIRLAGVGAEDCVRRTQAVLTELLRHEHASLALAQRASAVPPPAPLFTTLLNYRHTALAAAGDEPLPPMAGIKYLGAEERSNYPLALDIDDRGEDFTLTVVSAGQVDPALVVAMLDRALAGLADALEQAPDAPIGRLDVLPAGVRDRLLAAADGGAPVRQARPLLHQLFADQVAARPDAEAVRCDGTSLSYRELDQRANRLAHALRAHGVGPDRLVALCFERSLDMVVGLLAVLKAGGGYLPLDPAYPAERLAAMLADSRPVAVLTHPAARAVLADPLAAGDAPPLIDLVADAAVLAALPSDDPAVPDLRPDHLAYVIYTSGTTGIANGVQVEHRQLAAIAAAWQRDLALRPGLTHLQMASLSFDVCTADVIRALGFGGRLVLCPRQLLADPAGLYDLLREHQVDFADFVPAVLVPLMAHVESVGGDLAGFDTLICGSDAWTPADARRLRALCGNGVRIVNAYGVTEAAVDSSHYLLPAQDDAELTCLPIGRPLPGVRIYLLDESGEPVPDGVAGEIHLGGAGVARGYLNRPELTARRFRSSPFVAGDRLYRTGDLGRRLPDGNIEFLGRRDFQVKIRGLRVELAEIETVLASCPGVREAVVTAADQRLVAYYLAEPAGTAEPGCSPGDLRDRLAAALPAHMVPAAYVRLDAWPLSPNGKLDRAALPAPGADSYSHSGYAEPADELEAALAAIWTEVLGVDRVGRGDDFFALGGHSLLAMRLVARVRQLLGREVSPAALFAAPTLAGFAERLRTATGPVLPPIEPADRSGPLALSFAQQRLWFLAEQLPDADQAYHMPQAWQLIGSLDPVALVQAWDALVARHETLRTRFVPAADGSAAQRIDPSGPSLRVEESADAIAELCAAEAVAPFDLAAAPPARARLVRLGPDRHLLLVTLHHIVSDGWSVGVLIRELADLYGAFRDGRRNPLAPLPVQYADYAAWQRQWLTGGALAEQAEYWRRTLAGAPALLTVPADRPRPAEQDFTGGRVRLEFDAELTGALKAVSQRHGTTLFMTLLAGWALVLSRLSGQPEVVIGTPTANRRRDELAGLIGFFVNTLALRVELSGSPTGAELLHRVRELTLAALDHQDLPFEQVVESVNPVRSLSYTPLFQALFTWQDQADAGLGFPGTQAVAVDAAYPAAKFDLTLSLTEQDGRLVGALDYACALFDPATAERYAGYLHQVLRQLATEPDRPVSTFALVDEPERRSLLAFGDGATPNRELPGIHTLFEERAIETPDATAVLCEVGAISYRELNAQANRLAHHLRGHGVGPDVLVAVCLSRSIELIVALVAVAKAGGGYVPLDPAYPAKRLEFMLADSAAALLLTGSAIREELPPVEIPLLYLDTDAETWADEPATDPAQSRRPDQLAYLIYTSGSTGRPKGVAQTWRCADNLIDWMLRTATPDSPPPGRVLQFASTSFDVSFQEIWSTLCAGATLVLIGEQRRAELAELRRFLAEHQVQRAFLPAAVLQQLAVLTDSDALSPSLNCEIVTAGEALRINDEVRALLAQLGGDRLYNHYGPTETHAATSHTLVRAEAADWPALPPIGRPIQGARIYLLDDELMPVPVGVVGEIYIGGDCLARGYLNRPGLTAAKFGPDPFAEPGARMYRTGDLARWLPDGVLDYVGRADGQVKIRGFRVEPGEVESVLQQLPGVRQAAVLVAGEGTDRHLVGYLAADTGVEEIRERLRSRLPDYLVPTRWLLLDELPLTPNGKLDRRALPAPDEAAGGTPYVAPRTPQEAAMATIWAEILRRGRVGVHDDFFALGGHSLLATRLVHAINQRMSARLSLRDLFRHPVLADLAARLAGGDGDAAAAYVFPPLQPDPAAEHQPFPLTDIQQAYWVGRESSIELGGVGAHGYSELRLAEFDEQRFCRALDRLIARHGMLRAVFDADGSQRVLPDVPPYRMPRLDLRGLPAEVAEARLAELREQMSHRVFDAGSWPLFEFALTVLDDELRLHVGIDGLIVDVASSQILERELSLLYTDPDAELPPLTVSFRDYVLAERALRDTARYERALRYWRSRVAELAPAPGLPLVQLPEAVRRPHFTRYDRWLPEAQWSALKAAATRRGVTPSVLLLTAFAEVLGRWSRQPRFTLSLPLFNRLPLHPDINSVIGDFTSLVLLEMDVAGDAGFADRARAVQERLWQDIDHAAVSGVRVNRELARARGTAQAAMPIVFNSTLSELVPDAEDGGLAAALGAEPVHSITQTPQVWLDHTVLESAGRLYYNWDSLDELFPPGLVAEMFDCYGRLLDRLAEPDGWLVGAPDLLPDGGLAEPEPDTESTGLELPLLHELFDRRAAQTPDAPAVLATDRQISYHTLRAEARALAGRLQARGVRPGELVAVLADRGWRQVVSVLAVLYAGAAYLPIDPAWPADRIGQLLERAEARFALVAPDQPLPVNVEPVVVAAGIGGPAPEPVDRAGSDLAYLIYTSGSTGAPKGVMIDHRGAVNTLLDVTERFGLHPGDRVLAISSLSFDLSVFDIFGALAAGAAVVTLEPELARDPAHWLELAERHRVSVWNSVPALLGLLVEYAESSGRPLPDSLRLAMLSGDWIPVSLPGRARRLLPRLELHSLGGATEASIWSIHYPIGEVDPAWRSIPYGRALRGQRCQVLDDALRPRPVWAVGQIHIGGIGLALGYWRDPETTAAKFVIHPGTGERLYRTGDLGRLLPDGTIEFLGREDGQVKVHGYRVELGEIEAALESHPAVRAAAVRLFGDAQGDKRLAGYLVAAGSGLDTAELTRHLAGMLPAYMVPASLTVLDALPLSANGKVDRSRLPEPVVEPAPAVQAAQPDDPAERRLIAVVERILNIPGGIDLQANLLRLGATSIDIVRIGNALHTELGFRPSLAALMRQPTLADLLGMFREHVRASTEAGAAQSVVEDPAARAQFKARGEGRRRFAAEVPAIELPVPADPAFGRRYRDYRSVRQFAQAPVDARNLAALLACLASRELDGAAKYLYGSAGGAYPVQAYLYVKPGRVAGLPGGAYYYDPRQHRLVELGRDRVLDPDAYDYFVNRPVFLSGAFALFLVAELAAIEPLYGEQSVSFCHIEAGGMAQLLTMAAVEHRLGLCGIGSVDPQALQRLFDLGPTHRLVYSMIGGARQPDELEPGADELEPGADGLDAELAEMEDLEI
jgi:amino acid adenylation domain-containing protein